MHREKKYTRRTYLLLCYKVASCIFSSCSTFPSLHVIGTLSVRSNIEPPVSRFLFPLGQYSSYSTCFGSLVLFILHYKLHFFLLLFLCTLSFVLYILSSSLMFLLQMWYILIPFFTRFKYFISAAWMFDICVWVWTQHLLP